MPHLLNRADPRALVVPARRAILLALLAGSTAACADMFGGSRQRVASRQERLVRLIEAEGRATMFAPEGLAIMGLANGNRDVPVKQLGQGQASDRYVVSLTGIRSVREFIFHRREGDTLHMHLAEYSALKRIASATYPRNGRPTRMPDAVAEADYQRQLDFWMQRIPGR